MNTGPQYRHILLCIACLLPLGQAFAADRPNIIMILTDDQGWWDMGVHGNTAIETPVMDRLAAEGTELTRFYACPVCTPNRASLMTGRHYQRTGAVDTYMGLDVLDEREVTLGQVLQKQGYRTGLVGKWHLGRYMRYHPTLRGFDEFFGFWQYGFINRYDDSDELFEARKPVVTTGYITDVLTDRAINFVNANRDHPFFLYMAYNAPHSPYLAPDPYIEKYLKKGLPLHEARIYGMVSCVDENIGRLLATVDKAGLHDRTIVLFMSDNGGVSSYYKAGLRGRKGTVYEGGVRAPFFIRWPGHIEPGRKSDALAANIDVLPTLCELTGTPLPTANKLDGSSLMPLLTTDGAKGPHKYLFHQWNRGKPRPDESWAARDERYKLVNGELFDLTTDPGEAKNIAADHPEKMRELKGAFDRWFADVTAGRAYERVPIEVGRDDENPVEIDLCWSEPGKKAHAVYVHYTRDLVEDWTQEGDGIRWKIDVTQAGQYEVSLEYGCEAAEAGSVFRLSFGNASLDGVVEPTGGRTVFQSRVIGAIDLPKGPGILEMKALRIKGRELMALHKIWLRRLP